MPSVSLTVQERVGPSWSSPRPSRIVFPEARGIGRFALPLNKVTVTLHFWFDVLHCAVPPMHIWFTFTTLSLNECRECSKFKCGTVYCHCVCPDSDNPCWCLGTFNPNQNYFTIQVCPHRPFSFVNSITPATCSPHHR